MINSRCVLAHQFRGMSITILICIKKHRQHTHICTFSIKFCGFVPWIWKAAASRDVKRSGDMHARKKEKSSMNISPGGPETRLNGISYSTVRHIFLWLHARSQRGRSPHKKSVLSFFPSLFLVGLKVAENHCVCAFNSQLKARLRGTRPLSGLRGARSRVYRYHIESWREVCVLASRWRRKIFSPIFITRSCPWNLPSLDMMEHKPRFLFSCSGMRPCFPLYQQSVHTSKLSG